MGIATAAGAFYAFMVFLIGFVFGTIRILVLAPRLGETAAIVLETPIMLAASWFVCRWCVDRLGVPRRVIARSVMGAAAFVVLMSAEVGLAVLVFGRSATEHIPSYGSVPGEIALAAQIVLLLPHAKAHPRSISRTDRSALEYTV
jgi:hypothetical protein